MRTPHDGRYARVSRLSEPPRALTLSAVVASLAFTRPCIYSASGLHGAKLRLRSRLTAGFAPRANLACKRIMQVCLRPRGRSLAARAACPPSRLLPKSCLLAVG